METALPPETFSAAYDDKLKQALKYLRKGGHVGARSRCAEKEGATLLHAATAGARVPVAEALLKRGASVDQETDKGVTSLMTARRFLAARSRHAEDFEILRCRLSCVDVPSCKLYTLKSTPVTTLIPKWSKVGTPAPAQGRHGLNSNDFGAHK